MRENSKGKITKAQLSQSLLEEIFKKTPPTPGDGGGNTGSGIANLAINKFSTTITTNTDNVIICPANEFNKDIDQILVFKNSVYIESGQDYTINTDNTISKIGGHWEASIEEPTVFNFIIFKTTESIGSSVATYMTKVNNILVNDWSSTPNENGMYTATVRHNLGSENLILDAIDVNTKKNILVPCTLIDENTIEVEAVTKNDIRLIIANIDKSRFIEGEVNARDVSITDTDNLFTSTNVEGALREVMNKVTEGGGHVPLRKSIIDTSAWSLNGRLYEYTFTHNLAQDLTSIMVYKSETKDAVDFSYKLSTDNNSVKISVAQPINAEIVVTGSVVTRIPEIEAAKVLLSANRATFGATNVEDAISLLEGRIIELEKIISANKTNN